MNPGRLTATIALLCTLAILASACGRRPGTLQTPYEAAKDARQEAKDSKKPLPPEPKKPPEDRPFFLDKLIQ
jgi:hypothetical protein